MRRFFRLRCGNKCCLYSRLLWRDEEDIRVFCRTFAAASHEVLYSSAINRSFYFSLLQKVKMTLKPSIRPVQYLLLPVVLLFCFGGVFYAHYKPHTRWLMCPKRPLCTDQCIDRFKENFTQGAKNTSTLENQQLLITTPAVREEKENHDTLMLIWAWPFGFTFEAEACSSQFGIKGCQFTTDRSQYDEAHGVVFHHRDISGDLAHLQNTPRPSHQKWVWMNMESPDNSPRRSEIDGLFNLTSTYLRDSDVWVPYGRIVRASEKNKSFKIPPKDKLVCWIVSNWNPNFRRVKYFNELRKHIKVEVYGSAFNRYLNDDDYKATMSSCKFYLSFESSTRKDYFTEKLFNAMKLDVVPVVLGPSRENYEEFIPADSFIHVDDFESPEKLAEHLTFLDQNQEKYEQYFNWRKLFTAESTFFGLEHACRSCDHIRKYGNYRVFKSITKWFWD